MAALTSLGESSLAEPVRRPHGMQASQRRRLNLFRYLVFTIFGLFFVLPLLALARFSLEGKTPGSWSLAAWKQIATYRARRRCCPRSRSRWSWPSSPALSCWCCWCRP